MLTLAGGTLDLRLVERPSGVTVSASTSSMDDLLERRTSDFRPFVHGTIDTSPQSGFAFGSWFFSAGALAEPGVPFAHEYELGTGAPVTVRIDPAAGELVGDLVGVNLTASVSGRYTDAGAPGFTPQSEIEVRYDAAVRYQETTTTFFDDRDERLDADNQSFDDTVPATTSFFARIGETFTVDLGMFSSGAPLDDFSTQLQFDYHVRNVVGFTSVTAEFDDQPDSALFGTYLPGVALDNEFTVGVNDTQGVIAQVEYEISGSTLAGNASQAGSDEWTFVVDVGALNVLGHRLTLRARDKDGRLLDTTIRDIVMFEEPLSFTLTARPTGGTGSFVDVEELRLLHDVPVPLTYRAEIGNLPFAADPDDKQPYADRLTVAFVARGGGHALLDAGEFTDGEAEFAALGKFADVDADPSELDYDFFVVPAADHGAATRHLSGPESLFVTRLPAFMADPQVDFSTDAGLADVFGSVGLGAYVIEFDFPHDLQLSLPTTSGTPFGLFDGLATSLGIGARLVAYARPTLDEDAKVRAEELFVEATMLGQRVLDQTSRFPVDRVTVTALLDPKTLAAPAGITITTPTFALAPRSQFLFQRSFGSSLNAVPWLVWIPRGILNARLSIEGSLQAAISTLEARASLTVQLDNQGRAVLDPTQTFVEVTAAGGARATLGAGFTVEVVGFNIANAALAGTIFADLESTLVVNFSGNPAQPTANFNESESFVTLTAGYSLRYNLQAFGATLAEDTFADKLTLPLFGLPRRTPSLQQGELDGAGDENGRVLGATAPPQPSFRMLRAAPAAAAVTAAAAATTSTYTLDGSLYDTFRGGQLRYTVLAGARALTPDRHFLEAVLVHAGGEISLGRIDLALVPLAPAANSLGFASGAQALLLTVPGPGLEFGVPYALRFRLITDTTAEQVAVALEDLQLEMATPQLAVTASGTTLADGRLDFPAEVSSSSATLTLANQGTAPLHLGAIDVAGAGFQLVAGPDRTTLFPGETTMLRVAATTTQAANATLRIAALDPGQSPVAVALRRIPAPVLPVPTPAPTPPPPTPPAEPVGPNVTRLFRFTRGRMIEMSRTGLAAGYLRTSQFVTLHYLGDEPLRPPLGWLVLSLDGLARSIRLENGTGTGAGSGRLADPSRAIRLHQFSPGRSITVQLIFIRRAGQRLAYAPRVLTGIATTLDARRPTTDLTRLFRVERRITVDLPRGTGTFGKVLTRQAVRLHYLGESHLLPPFGRLVLALYDLPHGVELHNASEAGALPYRSIRLLHLSPGRAVDVELIFERESGSRIAYTSRVLANAP